FRSGGCEQPRVAFCRVGQRLIEVGQQVGYVFYASRVAHQCFGDAHGCALLLAEFDVAAGAWRGDRRLDRAEVGSSVGEAQPGREVLDRLEVALRLERQQATEPRICRLATAWLA